MNTTSGARYSKVAMILHWVIAIAVIVNWRIAEGSHGLEGAAKSAALAPHRALGITILALSVLRLAWRLMHRPPPLAATLAGWERVLARTTHILFYVLLIGLPIGGWLASSYASIPIDYFGLFAIPALPVAQDYDMAKAIIEVHEEGGSVLLLLVALHTLAALKHQFYDKDGNLSRMLPWGTPKA